MATFSTLGIWHLLSPVIVLLAAQTGPKLDENLPENSEIVVVGRRPQVKAGLWLVEKGTTFPLKVTGNSKPLRGETYTSCLKSTDLEPALRLILDDNKQIDAANRCKRMRIRFEGSSIRGEMLCSAGLTSYGQTVRGEFVEERVDVRVISKFSRFGRNDVSSEYRTQVHAHRLGECPADAP